MEPTSSLAQAQERNMIGGNLDNTVANNQLRLLPVPTSNKGGRVLSGLQQLHQFMQGSSLDKRWVLNQVDSWCKTFITSRIYINFETLFSDGSVADSLVA